MAEHRPNVPDSPAPRRGAARPERDRPWVMRTYAGHSSAAASNALYRRNLAKGQTGLSVAFDLPTQTGYDPDHPLARGEVGKVGVPISHIGDMRALFDSIPLAQMNTSMTINATAMWLLALYQVVAEEQARRPATDPAAAVRAAGRHHPERHHQGVPVARDLRLPARPVAAADHRHGRLHRGRDARSGTRSTSAATTCRRPGRRRCRRSPTRCAPRSPCSTRCATPGRCRPSGSARSSRGSRSSSTPACGSSRRCARCAPSSQLWDELTRDRYGVQDPKQRRFRYGVQVNSLGLTEAQPENNVQRIVLEMLAVTLSKDARARAVQLPAWNEALGLPRPWDQQWSLRMQQVLAFESDLLEYDDLFAGSVVVEAKVAELVAGARAEIARVQEMGGAVAAVESGYMKSALVASHALRRQRIESGEDVVVGVNRFETTEPNPLTADLDAAIQTVDPEVEARAAEAVAPLARGARRRRRAASSGSRRRSPGCARRRAPAPTSWPRRWSAPGPGSRRGSGPARCARSSASTAPRPGCPARSASAAEGDAALAAVRERVRAHRRGARRAAARAGRQAGPRRPQQRRRAGRRAGARRRVRGRLPGHPADAGADRRGRGGRGRAPGRASRSCPARTWSWCPRSCAGCARPVPATCRSSSAASSPTPTRGRCAPRGSRRSSRRRTSGSPRSWAGFVDEIRRARGLGAGTPVPA